MGAKKEMDSLNQLAGSLFRLMGTVTLAALRWCGKETRKVIGLVICVGLFCAGFALEGNMGLYFNVAALLIVLGGTFGATLICFQTKRLMIVYQVLRTSYRTRVKEPDEIVAILVDLAVKSRLRGMLSLQEDEDATSMSFLRRALGFLVDGYKAREIKDFLCTEMQFFRLRREESERVLRTMAEICPAFGLVGSVVGLVSLIAGVGEPSVVLSAVPIALISTLYGVVLANFVFLPFAANIRERTDRELLLQRIVTDAVLAIESEVNPRVLEMKLKSFLTPSSRHGRLVSLERIQKKFNIQPKRSEPASTRRPSTQHS